MALEGEAELGFYYIHWELEFAGKVTVTAPNNGGQNNVSACAKKSYTSMGGNVWKLAKRWGTLAFVYTDTQSLGP